MQLVETEVTPMLSKLVWKMCEKTHQRPAKRASIYWGRAAQHWRGIGTFKQLRAITSVKGRACFKHDEDLIARFLALREEAWRREGLPFHIWPTSPALEILDLTFAMNLRWAKSREECARQVIYQSIRDSQREPIYHPTLVGEQFLARIGVVG